MKKVRIGAGSAFWGDMLEPAVELAEKVGSFSGTDISHFAKNEGKKTGDRIHP